MTTKFLTHTPLTPPHTTVSVAISESHPNVMLMQWEKEIETGDVAAAFEQINMVLNSSSSPMYVLVDILSKPQFPMSETISSALRGSFGHENLKAWLIAGENRLAHVIEKVLSNITRRKNVEWFTSMDDVIEFLDLVVEASSGS